MICERLQTLNKLLFIFDTIVRDMEEFSDRHTEAIRYLAKANTDLAEAIQAATNKQFATAYSKTLRVKESIRLILEVQNDLTPEDRDSTE